MITILKREKLCTKHHILFLFIKLQNSFHKWFRNKLSDDFIPIEAIIWVLSIEMTAIEWQTFSVDEYQIIFSLTPAIHSK